MRISVRQLATWVGLFGLLTVGLLLMNRQTTGQLFAFAHLGLLVGAPLAWLLYPQLRSRVVVAIVGVALSVALSSLAVQSLIWFGLAGRATVVLAATVYGVVLAWLLSSDSEPAGGDAGEPVVS